MIVVFDTNIWKTNLYLKSPASAAVKFFLVHHGAKVGLPEVVRLEVERHLRADIYEFRDQIMLGHRQLLGLFGRIQELVLPTDNEIEALVTSIFFQSGFDLQEVPFSQESARDSFLRTVDKIPPSHKSQQFKDGVIWKDCKTLADAEEVVLVTADRAFYEGGETKKGLAKMLMEEARQCQYELRVLPGLADLLSELRRPIVVDDVVFENAVSVFLQRHVDEILERTQFSLASPLRFKKSLFVTQYPGSLYVEFVAEAYCEDATGEGRMNSVLQITADGLYLLNGKTMSNVQIRELVITYTGPDGRSDETKSVFGSVNIVMGHRIVTNEVREPLDVSE